MDQAFLATIPYLRDLKESERASLMHCIAPVGVAPEGGILFDVGEASDGAYIVRAGELHVELPLPDGTHRVVARLGQGTLVGELSLIEHTPRTMRVRVMPGSQLYRIDRHRFTAMRQAGHLAAYKVIRSVTMTMCDRLRDTNMRIEERWQGRSSTTGDVSIASLQTEVKMSAWDRLRRLFGRD